MSRSRGARVHPAVALALDVVLVLAFAAIGRASHAETGSDSSVLGILETAWTFLVGTLVGWAVVRLLRKDWPVDVGPGITVWFSTLVFGILLRVVTGQGTALPFVAVAALVLALLLVGWRVVATAMIRRRSDTRPQARSRP